MEDLALILVVAVALGFDFTNGFHDAANSIATVVATRVLSPRYAVMWDAFFNFVAFLVFKTEVARPIGKGGVEPGRSSSGLFLAAWSGPSPGTSSPSIWGCRRRPPTPPS